MEAPTDPAGAYGVLKVVYETLKNNTMTASQKKDFSRMALAIPKLSKDVHDSETDIFPNYPDRVSTHIGGFAFHPNGMDVLYGDREGLHYQFTVFEKTKTIKHHADNHLKKKTYKRTILKYKAMSDCLNISTILFSPNAEYFVIILNTTSNCGLDEYATPLLFLTKDLELMKTKEELANTEAYFDIPKVELIQTADPKPLAYATSHFSEDSNYLVIYNIRELIIWHLKKIFEYKALDDQLAVEAQAQPTRIQPARGQSAREQPTRVQPTRVQPARGQSAKVQPPSVPKRMSLINGTFIKKKIENAGMFFTTGKHAENILVVLATSGKNSILNPSMVTFVHAYHLDCDEKTDKLSLFQFYGSTYFKPYYGFIMEDVSENKLAMSGKFGIVYMTLQGVTKTLNLFPLDNILSLDINKLNKKEFSSIELPIEKIPYEQLRTEVITSLRVKHRRDVSSEEQQKAPEPRWSDGGEVVLIDEITISPNGQFLMAIVHVRVYIFESRRHIPVSYVKGLLYDISKSKPELVKQIIDKSNPSYAMTKRLKCEFNEDSSMMALYQRMHLSKWHTSPEHRFIRVYNTSSKEDKFVLKVVLPEKDKLQAKLSLVIEKLVFNQKNSQIGIQAFHVADRVEFFGGVVPPKIPIYPNLRDGRRDLYISLFKAIPNSKPKSSSSTASPDTPQLGGQRKKNVKK